MTEPKYLIWSNYSLDYEDWREDPEAEYPELSNRNGRKRCMNGIANIWTMNA